MEIPWQILAEASLPSIYICFVLSALFRNTVSTLPQGSDRGQMVHSEGGGRIIEKNQWKKGRSTRKLYLQLVLTTSDKQVFS